MLRFRILLKMNRFYTAMVRRYQTRIKRSATVGFKRKIKLIDKVEEFFKMNSMERLKAEN